MNNDMIMYQEKLKENIKELINLNRLEAAKEILIQYEGIVRDDIDVYSIKGVIAMMEGDMNEAERILKAGLNIEHSNFNLLYNVAYLYQSTKQEELAIEYYKKALQNADNEGDRDEAYRVLQGLGVTESRKEILEDAAIEEKADVLAEMESYKKQFKENIQFLIEQGLLKEAKDALNQYEGIVKDDVDIHSIKGVIAMTEGDMEEAERMLKEGFLLDGENFDLAYNLAYFYQSIEQKKLAIKYYKKALQNAKNESDADEVYEVLKKLGIQESKKEIIDSKIPKTSIIILTYNNLKYNKVCIESIRKYTRQGTYEIIVVDNNSTDGTVEWLKQQKDIKLILNHENLGFPKGCNQGIKIAEKGNDILLLNNDTIVTPNWLENLKKCLYSNEYIGAAGSVTNSCSNYQTIPVNYSNFEEMIKFAENNNISNEASWEERLRLVGFCMLIKNKVVKEVGLLDEIFTPGNFEDDDYSYRIRKAGYRLMLCKDSFIYHFGSASFGKISKEYNELLVNNRRKFFDKWGFDPYYIADINRGITQIIQSIGLEDINILNIGCAGGGTLLDIKNVIPSSNLYGIESVRQAVINTHHFAQIEIGSINKVENFNKNYFDFIIMTQPQENEKKLISILKRIKNYLKTDGYIYANLKIKEIRWNPTFIQRLQKEIQNCQFEIIEKKGQLILKMEKSNKIDSKKGIKLTLYNVDDIRNLSDKQEVSIKISSEEDIILLLRRLENDIAFENNLEILREFFSKDQIDVVRLKEIVINHIIHKTKVLNIIGIIYFQMEVHDVALFFLKEAFQLDERNKDTIYNIAFVLHTLGDNKAAFNFLEQVKVMDDIELEELKWQIKEVL